MGTRKRLSAALPLLAVAAYAIGCSAQARADLFTGNGATGFGGPVGQGTLSVTDDGAGNVTFAFTPSASHASVDGNNLVIYLSTGAPGLSDTSALTDNGDSGREGISGYNASQSPPTRSLIAFPSGFAATYALAMEGGFVGLFQLPPVGGDGNLIFVTGANQSGNPLTLTIPLSDIGLAQSQSFSLVGTLLDGTSAYRSNEAIGATNPDISTGGNPGFNNLITFSTFDTYNTTAVPEPAGLSLLALGALASAHRRRVRSIATA